MPVDVKQFLQTFIDESTEMLGESESILLNLNIENIDPDSIHKLFRFIHSIKGASSVFKFDSISELAHTLENYLEKIN